jgi:hypothetical protein
VRPLSLTASELLRLPWKLRRLRCRAQEDGRKNWTNLWNRINKSTIRSGVLKTNLIASPPENRALQTVASDIKLRPAVPIPAALCSRFNAKYCDAARLKQRHLNAGKSKVKSEQAMLTSRKPPSAAAAPKSPCILSFRKGSNSEESDPVKRARPDWDPMDHLSWRYRLEKRPR